MFPLFPHLFAMKWWDQMTWSYFECSLVVHTVKNLSVMWKTHIWSLGREDPLEKGVATHSSIPAWRILWTEKPKSMESQRVGHNWATNVWLLLSSFTFIKRLFSSSSLSAIIVVTSAHLRLLIVLLAILIPACSDSMIYKINKAWHL